MKQITSEVSVTFKTPGADEKVITAPVSYAEFESAEDVLAFLSSNPGETIGNLNYAASMKARADVRAEIKAVHEGPGKAVAKVVKNFIEAMKAMGVTLTEDAALAQMKSIPAFSAALEAASK